MLTVGKDLLRAFHKSLLCFVFQGTSEKHGVKIVVTIIFKSLVTNSLLSLFSTFVETKNKDQSSGKWWCCSKKYFCFFFIPSRLLFQKYPASINFYKTIFLYVIPNRINFMISWTCKRIGKKVNRLKTKLRAHLLYS